jgi:hypothetical protein
MVHPLIPSQARSVAQAEGAIAGAELQKHQKYDQPCQRAGVEFKVFAANTFGALGVEAHQILNIIAQRRSALADPTEREEVYLHLRQQCTLTAMKAVATQLLQAFPVH